MYLLDLIHKVLLWVSTWMPTKWLWCYYHAPNLIKGDRPAQESGCHPLFCCPFSVWGTRLDSALAVRWDSRDDHKVMYISSSTAIYSMFLLEWVCWGWLTNCKYFLVNVLILFPILGVSHSSCSDQMNFIYLQANIVHTQCEGGLSYTTTAVAKIHISWKVRAFIQSIRPWRWWHNLAKIY